MNTYEWQNNLTQEERDALIVVFGIKRDVSKVKVRSTPQGDVVDDDGIDDGHLGMLGDYSIEQLREIAKTGVVPEKVTSEESQETSKTPETLGAMETKSEPKKRGRKPKAKTE